jgi:hypothetical protein
MPSYLSGPFNIGQGNSANFTVEFFDSNGFLSIPPSATMSVTYVNTTGASQTDPVTLVSGGRFFTGIWSSTSAALGIATWVATALPSSVQAASGQLRIIERGST